MPPKKTMSKKEPLRSEPKVGAPTITPARRTPLQTAIWEYYERWIQKVEMMSDGANQPIGQWQDILGEIVMDLTIRARG